MGGRPHTALLVVPYKIIILAFDIAVLFALCRIAPRDKRTAVAAMYWVNPWFILHEAYHAFWEGPHILLGLLAVLAARHIRRSAWRWVAAGALLACSAMFKPQGLLHLPRSARTIPCSPGVVRRASAICVVYVRRSGSRCRDFAGDSGRRWFGTGALRKLSKRDDGDGRHFKRGTGNLAIRRVRVHGDDRPAAGHSVRENAENADRRTVRVCRCADTRNASRVLRFVSGCVKPTAPNAGSSVLAVLAFGSLVMSQFGVRAHINHSYGAMVLLIPLAVSHERLRTLWMGMCALLGISHALVYGLGHAALLPPENLFDRYPAASGLIARVRVLPAYVVPDWPLRLQGSVQDTIAAWPAETIVSLLSVPVFVLACLMARELFTVVRSDRP